MWNVIVITIVAVYCECALQLKLGKETVFVAILARPLLRARVIIILETKFCFIFA